MKCLLCNYISNSIDDIKDHYTIYHKINKNNFFFQQLLLNQNGFLNSDCARCHEFLTTKKFMAKHNFLKHYIDGERKPAEFKPIEIIRNQEVTIYQITYEKHSDEYDFYNSTEVVEDFLFNVKRLYKPANKVIFKGSFSIENIQNAPIISPDIADMKSQRYWSTQVHKGIYFNDFIAAEIRDDILKRVINNNLTGSSWHFHRFIYLNVKVIDEEQKISI